MSSLFRCNQVIGNATIIRHDPNVRAYDAVFIPNLWGVYDHGRRLITDSAYFRGPGPELIGTKYVLGSDWPSRIKDAPEDSYYYVGPIHAHYGHFLLASFSRLWALRKFRGQRMKLVTYALPNLQKHPYIRSLLSAVGYSIDDCITFDRPTHIKEMIIAAPSFEETNYVHSTYSDLCRLACKQLIPDTNSKSISTPVYLAKFALKGGISKMLNEEIVADALQARGVKIVFPEQLTFMEQLRLFVDHDHISGLMGSAFHTASFAEPKHLLMLAYHDRIPTNQILVDKVSGHKSVYVYPRHGVKSVKTERFHAAYVLNEPKRVAEDFLRLFDMLIGVKQDEGRESNNDKDRLLEPKIAGTINLALGKRTRQSSVSSNRSLGMNELDDSAGAISGFCTGGFQFHTRLEQQPWWEVDLGQAVSIQEVRLFNRLDANQQRASCFSISVSDDGNTWMEVFRKEDAKVFGGLDGRPFSWFPPHEILARFVRITLLATTPLHLDQVAVFGKY